MKKILSFVVGCFAFISLSAQDKIVLKNAEVIDAFGVDVGEKSLYYQLEEAEHSPWWGISKSQVLLIQYQNGTSVELFQQNEASTIKELLSLSKDKIITRTADVIPAFGVDLSERYVYYKAENRHQAPLLRLSRDKVLLVKRQDGSVVEVFQKTDARQEVASALQKETGAVHVDAASRGDSTVAVTPVKVGQVSEHPAVPARVPVKKDEGVTITSHKLNRALLSKNQQFMDEMNAALQINHKDKKYWNKKADLLIAQLGVKENSVIFDGRLQVRFYMGELTRFRPSQPLHFTVRNAVSENDINDPAVLVSVENKFTKTIYLDLGRTYFVRMGDSICYYQPSSAHTANRVTVDLGPEKKATGVGTNGISSVNTVYTQRYVAIAPKSVVYLNPQYLLRPDAGEVTPGLECVSKSFDQSAVDHLPSFIFNSQESKKLKVGQPISYNEEDSPLQMSLILSYSEDQSCRQETSVPVHLYLKELVGVDSGKFTLEDPSKRLFFGAGIAFTKKQAGFPLR